MGMNVGVGEGLGLGLAWPDDAERWGGVKDVRQPGAVLERAYPAG